MIYLQRSGRLISLAWVGAAATYRCSDMWLNRLSPSHTDSCEAELAIADQLELYVTLEAHRDSDDAPYFDALFDEKPSLTCSEDIIPRRMRYRTFPRASSYRSRKFTRTCTGDIPRATTASLAALAPDPLEAYLRAPARQTAAQRALYRCAMRVHWAHWVALRRAWTVRGGASVVVRCASPPASRCICMWVC